MGQQRTRQRREKDKRSINKLQKSLEKSKKEADKWRKRYKRLQKKESKRPSENSAESPGKIVNKIITAGPDEVRKKLLIGVGLSLQLKQNSILCKTQSEKRRLAENISGDIITNKKLKTAIEKQKIISTYYQRNASKKKNRGRKLRKTHIHTIRHEVISFLLDPENSCQAPGKRDYITRKKVQKQKRYLLLPLKELHKKFIEKTGCKISYTTFTKIKPFWVVHKKVDQRDTCMCIMHANFKFKLDKLKLLRLIKTNSCTEILKKSVCDIKKRTCMYGLCNECSIKIPEELLSFQNVDDFNTFYYKWTAKIEEQKSKKGDKIIKTKKTLKEKFMCTAYKLLEEANKELLIMAVHIFNMYHQHAKFKEIKTNLSSDEAVVICDWSENYSCKYGEEVQAIHFGASRNQVALHTGVAYIGEKKLKFCTVSDSTLHNAIAIWAHLEPVLELIKNMYPTTKTIHFFTDGPTSQYRNKTNFYLMCKFGLKLGFKNCSWNFWEPGHGKGPADGIGGLVKRTCDRVVSMGHDVTEAESFMKAISNLNISAFLIREYKIEAILNEVKEDENKILAVPGTMKLKSAIWYESNGPYTLILRTLTCATCRNNNKCNHYPPPATKKWILVPQQQSIIGDATSDQDCDNCSSTDLEGCPQNVFEPSTSRTDRIRYQYEDVYGSDSDSDDIDESSFILVKLLGKKSVCYFVAKVLEKHIDGDFSVSFLRRSVARKFVFPSVAEEKSVSREEVIKKLNCWKESRGRYEFNDDLSVYKNLN